MKRHISEYFRAYASNQTRAIIIGKGPSFDPKFNLTEFLSVAINETSKFVKADISFFIDLECYLMALPWLGDVRTIFMPTKPHYKHVPTEGFECSHSGIYSFDLARPAGHDVLQQSYEVRRESNEFPDFEPLIAVSNSFEAVFHMLCLSGIKEIFSLGVDGGYEYHPLFQTKQKPASKNPNLTQFETINKFASKYGVRYEKL